MTNGQNTDKIRGRAGSGASHSSFSWFPFGLGRLKNSCWVINSVAGAEICQPRCWQRAFLGAEARGAAGFGLEGAPGGLWSNLLLAAGSAQAAQGFTDLGSGSPQGWRACNCSGQPSPTLSWESFPPIPSERFTRTHCFSSSHHAPLKSLAPSSPCPCRNRQAAASSPPSCRAEQSPSLGLPSQDKCSSADPLVGLRMNSLRFVLPYQSPAALLAQKKGDWIFGWEKLSRIPFEKKLCQEDTHLHPPDEDVM